MNRYFKVEGNIKYPDKQMLTWGAFYYHSVDKAKEKMNDIMKWIVDWVNEKDKTLNIQPENIVKPSKNNMIAFHIKAWKDENHLEMCNGIINVEEIFFEDEQEQ